MGDSARHTDESCHTNKDKECLPGTTDTGMTNIHQDNRPRDQGDKFNDWYMVPVKAPTTPSI